MSCNSALLRTVPLMEFTNDSGDSPTAGGSYRSRQNSSSSVGSASHARTSSMFTHRQSSSSATQDIVRDYRARDKDRQHAATVVPQQQSHQIAGSTGNKGTFPSIRGYSTLHDIARPRTPLYDPMVSSSSNRQRTTGPPQIGSDADAAGDSYVASLGMAPLVTRPPQGGEAVYIPGGRAPTPQQLPSAFDASPNPGVAHQKSKASRPGLHQRTSSYNSYLGQGQQQSVSAGPLQQGSRFATRHGSRATTPRSRSRQNSHYSGNSSAKGLGSRFIRYDNPIADSPRARRRSSSLGALASTPLFSGWSPQALSTPGVNPLQSNVSPGATSANSRGRRSRTRNRQHGSGQSGTIKSETRRQARKLVSARLPAHARDHRDARLPSQPVGITWICGAGLVARDPSFYEDFEYADYPGGRRKRSLSRSTITPNNYRSSFEQSTEGGHAPAGYESEPENLDRRRARQASIDQYNRDVLAEQQQTGSRPTIQVMSDAERALRRKSQSLTNLRQAGLSDERERPKGLFISAPLASARLLSSSDFVKTPRTAPVPYLSSTSNNMRKMPSKASLDAMDDPVKRKEALLAALPPPNRRSPAGQTPSPHMFSTGRVVSTTVGQPEIAQYGQAFSTEGVLDEYTAAGDRSLETGGDLSPGLEDIRDYEASAFILREGNHTPIVYGHAFSGVDDAPESQEGEIIDDTRLSGRHAYDSTRSGLASVAAERSMGDRSVSDQSVAHRSNSSQSFAQSPSSHGASASSGSAHILDLNEESFTNLVILHPRLSR